MGIETLTDEKITQMITMPKRIENPQARERQEGKHLRRDFRVVSSDEQHRFTLFTRQSTKIGEGYSAGLMWHAKTGDEVMLLRCNGSDHPHPNALERERIDYRCHVHMATERYIQANRKTEGFATATDAYRSLGGALHHLVTRANIQGLATTSDEPDLFGKS